jgi:hypothetical protein
VNAPTRIAVDTNKFNAAIARFPRDRGMIIGGREIKGSGQAIERASPAHGVVVTRVPRGRADDAHAAIAAARTAFDKGSWPHETAATRARVLLKTADLIDRDREILALLDSLECGKPISQARGEIEGAADIWRYAAALARELSGESYANLGSDRLGFVLREPIGVVSIITPWNFPLLRRHEETVRFQPASAGSNLRAAVFRRPNMSFDLAEMIGADDRADASLRVEGIANLDSLRPLREAREEIIRDAGMQQQTRSRIAAFACIKIGTEGGGVERRVHFDRLAETPLCTDHRRQGHDGHGYRAG